MSTLETVARLAGVSPSTVSRTLARPEKVAEQTRRRVLQAVAQLGYQPFDPPRGLRQRGGRSIGLIVSDMLSPVQALLSKGVQDAADHHGLSVLLLSSDESAGREKRALDTLRGHLPQGVIIVPTAQTRVHGHLPSNLPVVELERSSGLSGVHTALIDNRLGAQQATAYLTGLGHSRIGVILGQAGVSTSAERLEGYQAALTAAGVAFQAAFIRHSRYPLSRDHEHSGFRAATELLNWPPSLRPTALLTGNPEMTLGAVLAARALNLRIPTDLSIIGFGDWRLLELLQPAISVVAEPTYELGYAATEALMSLLRRGLHGPPASVRLPPILIIRESTGPPGA